MRGLKFGSSDGSHGQPESHRSRGAWVEILKLEKMQLCGQSHRSRDAWVEIPSRLSSVMYRICRIAHAVRGLKFEFELMSNGKPSRIAHAVRGLKWDLINEYSEYIKSHRSRGAWVEITSD